MERVHASLLLLLTLLIASFTLTTSTSTNPQTPDFKNQNAKSVKKGNVHAKGEKDQTRILNPYSSVDGFQDMEVSKDDDMMVHGLNEAFFYGGPAQGYFGYPWPGDIFGFPRGIFGFPRGPFGFPLGFGRGFPGGYPGGYGGNQGGEGGNRGGYGGGAGLGNTPGGGGVGGYSGYGGKAEVKGKEVNPHD